MKFSVAIFLSLLAHGLLAALLVAYIKYAPGPDTLAQLDLSSVELSFADTEDESAAARPSLASAPAEPPPEPPPPEPERPPAVEPPPKELPPEPAAMKVPDPEPEPRPMETPPSPPETVKPKPEPPKEPPRSPAVASAAAPAAAPRQGRVEAPPRPRRNIKPDYPKGARQRGEQGDVSLAIVVSASGSVDDVKVASSSGYPELDDAAVKAVKAARFTPAKRNGRPVASSAKITLTFKLK